MQNKIFIFIVVFIILLVVLWFATFKLGLNKVIFTYVFKNAPEPARTTPLNPEELREFKTKVYLNAFLIATFFAIVGFFISRYKGYNPFLWALICFITNIIGLFILILKPNLKQT